MTIRSLLRRALVGVAALLLLSGTTEARLPHGTPIVVIPPAALAAGYLYRTYGPSVNIGGTCVAGQNCWYLFNFLGVTPVGGQAVQNGDGSITLPGNDGSGYGANVSTAHLVSGVLKGTSFKTGYYIEFLLKFTPTLGSSSLPFPATWSLDTGFLTGSYPWVGQPAGFNQRIENDFFQWPHNSTAFWAGDGLIHWYGYEAAGANLTGVQITGIGGQISFTSRTTHVGDFLTITGTIGGTGSISGYTTGTAYQVLATNGSTTATLGTVGGSAITTTTGTPTGLQYAYGNVTQPNPQQGAGEIVMTQPFSSYQRYGFLITPAKGATQGTIVNYFNDVQQSYAAGAPNATWNLYSAANGPPPVAASTAGALIDTLRMVLIMGTDSTCPMTILEVSVWQKDASGANTTSLARPLHAANDDFYELALAA